MAGFHDKFIEDMKKEFMGELAKKYPGKANGVRFTGYGGDGRLNKSRVAGAVHEGEQVIEADMVEEAGGPRRVRDAVEGLARENEQIMPVEDGPGRMPGFQLGTGDKVAGTYDPNQRFTGTPEHDPISIGFDRPEDTTTSQTVESTPTVQTEQPPIGFESAPQVTETFRVPTDTTVKLDKPPEEVKRMEPVEPPEVDFEEAPTITKEWRAEDDVEEEPEVGDDITKAGRLGADMMGDIIKGESEAARLAEERAHADLARKHEAERKSLNQSLAQQGASQEEIRTAMARLGAEQRAESEGVRSDIAIAKAERAEAAAVKAAEMGMTQEQYDTVNAQKDRMIDLEERGMDISEEMQRGYLDIAWAGQGLAEADLALRTKKLDTWIDQLGVENAIALDNQSLKWHQAGLNTRQIDILENESVAKIAQWGEDTAMGWAITNLQVNGMLADAAAAAGDYDTLGDILNTYGFDIDMSTLKDAATQEKYGKAAANLITDVDAVTGSVEEVLKDGAVQGDLVAMWNSTHETNLSWEQLSKDADFNTWANKKVGDMQIMNSPYGAIAYGMSDEEMNAIAESLGVDTTAEGYDVNDTRMNYANVFFSEGMVVNEDGTWSYDPSIIDDAMGIGEGVVYTQGEITPVENIGKLSQDDAFTELRNEYVNKGTEPPPELVLQATNSIGLEKLAEYDDSGGPTRMEEEGLSVGGWVNVDGNAVKVTDRFEAGGANYIVVEYDGKEYSYSRLRGTWQEGRPGTEATRITIPTGTVEPTKPPWDQPEEETT